MESGYRPHEAPPTADRDRSDEERMWTGALHCAPDQPYQPYQRRQYPDQRSYYSAARYLQGPARPPPQPPQPQGYVVSDRQQYEYELFGTPRNEPRCYYQMTQPPPPPPPQQPPPEPRPGYYLSPERYCDYDYDYDFSYDYGAPLQSVSEILASGGEPCRPSNPAPLPSSSPFVDVQEQAGTYSPFARNFLEVPQQKRDGGDRDRDRETEAASTRAPVADPPAAPVPAPAPVPPRPVPRDDVVKNCLPRKESEVILGAEPATKKRIVAEVKPMRPSYSDILAKGPRGQGFPGGPGGPAPSTPDLERKKRHSDFENHRNRGDKSKHGQDRGGGNHLDPGHQGQERDGVRREANSRTAPKPKSGFDNDSEYFIRANVAPAKSPSTDGDKRWASLEDLNGEKKCHRRKNRKSEPDREKSLDRDPDEDEDAQISDSESLDTSPSPPPEIEKTKRKSKEKYNGRSNIKNSEKFKKKAQSKQKRNRNFSFVTVLRSLSDRWISIIRKALVWFCCLILDIFQMSSQLIVDLYYSVSDDTLSKTRSIWSFVKNHVTDLQWLCDFGNYIDSKFGQSKLAFWRRFSSSKTRNKNNQNGEKYKTLKTNIQLPTTREEAMKRLLERKGKDPYSILGVGVDCTDDDIKRYYRRQAFLVHPDKNPQPGAEEAFKILQHAFDLIGEPERREAYDRKLIEFQHVEAAWSELSELVTQLHDKVKHAAGTIRCTNCSKRHKKTIIDRPSYAARYCSQCKIHHSAKEGDIWAESRFWGMFWMYYACMDGAVYQITQWASCQKKNLAHLKANTHNVQYRIVSGNKAGSNNSSGKSHNGIPDPNLEDFLSNLYAKSNMANNSGTDGMNSTNPNDNLKNKKKAKKKP